MRPKNSAENFGKCFCIKCSLYTECNKNKAERIFCAREVSECKMDTGRMCLCPTGCPIYSDNKLSGAYFCKIELKQ